MVSLFFEICRDLIMIKEAGLAYKGCTTLFLELVIGKQTLTAN